MPTDTPAPPPHLPPPVPAARNTTSAAPSPSITSPSPFPAVGPPLSAAPGNTSSSATATELTYASKLPPDHPGLRLDRAQPRTLKTGPAIAATLGLVGAGALAVAVATRSEVKAKPVDLDPVAKTVTIPDSVRAAPGNDSPLRNPPPPPLGPPLHGRSTNLPDHGQAHPDTPAGGGAQSPEQLQRQAQRQALADERAKALGAPLLVALDEPTQGDALPTGGRPAAAIALPADQTQPSAPTAAPPSLNGMADPNLQQRKNDFVERAGVNKSTTLDEAIHIPRSPYEILAGSIIPTSLITGIDSDLPGQIIGQVRENVYDTVTGQHLVIPQGSRLLATYDSMVGFGQERVLVCWNRVIRPDGISITLECMPGTDLAGYSGFADDVDHHWWRIITGIALGSLVSAAAQSSQGNVTGYQPTLPQLWVSGAAGGVNQATQQLTQKNLQIQPTIKIRPGFSVNVLVSKDLVLPPYVPQEAAVR